MRKNITNQEYKFETLSEMYQFLTTDNIDDFLIDFGSMLKQAVMIREQVISTLKEQELLETVDIDDVLDINYFTWHDDGEHDESKFKIGFSDDENI